ncbi:hypothetical protein BKA70DRAFT_298253 [Coprinopsis sp. MPI-PUGE-AT-0042]|nr:hypothetical protein BKA70DRAFT_298253 [Coprinopsis sp. MPI-PUGE-AT-0042]
MGDGVDPGEHAKGPVLGSVEETHCSSVSTPFRVCVKTVENAPLVSHRRIVASKLTWGIVLEDDWTGRRERESRAVLTHIPPLAAPSSLNTTSESTSLAPRPRLPRQVHHRQRSLCSTTKPPPSSNSPLLRDGRSVVSVLRVLTINKSQIVRRALVDTVLVCLRLQGCREVGLTVNGR